jgi:hypothetical protein
VLWPSPARGGAVSTGQAGRGMGRFMRGLLFLAITGVLAAAPSQDLPTVLDQGYAQMYNLQFADAHRSFQDWQRAYPDDPLGPVSEAAACLFSEFDRMGILQSEFFEDDRSFLARRSIAPDPELKRRFENALERSRELAGRILERDPLDKNAMFASILRSGLRSDYLALIDKRYLPSLQEMKAGRSMAEKLLSLDSEYYDAYLAIGVENYFLSLKPAPVRWFLRLGGARADKAQGLAKLRLTAEHGRYLRPFARLLLAVAALRDHDRASARELLSRLANDYPHNPLYAQELARLD